MYAIIDKRAPQDVKDNLKLYVKDIFEFSSHGITYNSISGHPDVFMFQEGETLIVAPNAPMDLISFLEEHFIKYSVGKEPVGKTLYESSRYNCLATKTHYFLKKGFLDVRILEYCKAKKEVFLPQSYVRCSLFAMNENQLITSDKGILKSLKFTDLECFYFDPKKIQIIDHSYGFLGGTVGKKDEILFFMGDILKHADGASLASYIALHKLKHVCLGSGYLYDGGALFFVS